MKAGTPWTPYRSATARALSILIDWTGYPLRINCWTAGRIFWHGLHQSAWKSSRTGSEVAPLDEELVAVMRASNKEGMVIPQGLLSLGSARGSASPRRRARAGPARCPASRDEARDDPWAGPPAARRPDGPSTRRTARAWHR